MMTNTWASYIVLSALTVSAIGFLIWNKTRKNFTKVGKVSKLFFYPVKSLKAVEVTKGKCTKLGLEVNGILDRSFMLVNEDGILVSQRQAPSLVLLTPHISENFLIINGPNIEPLKVAIKQSPSPEDKIINCKVHDDSVNGIDCGDEAASWFQSYLSMKGVRLVRFFPSSTPRKYTRKNLVFINLRKKYPAAFQDLTAVHIISQASVDDLNSRIEKKEISVYNFRPNIVVDDCPPYTEDSWTYMKIGSEQNELEMLTLILTTRCLLTTNDPETGILTQKEPLVTLRKYRIVADPALSKITGAVPCLGTSCAVLSPGEIAVGDDILAVVKEQPKMLLKST